MARDWLRLLDALELAEWCLVGFSQGGMIAQCIAALEPVRTKALVVMGSSCRTNPATQAAMQERLAAAEKSTRAAAELAAASVFSSAFAEREPDFIQRFIEQRAALEFAPLAAATRALYGFDIRPELARIACPTLVIAAAEDRLVPPEASAEIAAAIPGARLERIDATGHLCIVEQPQAVDRLLDAFFAEHYPALEAP
jgi:pimeloyl-ACP methyl ester carboxylesterase